MYGELKQPRNQSPCIFIIRADLEPDAPDVTCFHIRAGIMFISVSRLLCIFDLMLREMSV